MEYDASLEQRLLRDPVPHAAPPGGKASPPLSTSLLLSLFIAYHLVAVVVHSAPAVDPVRSLQAFLDRYARTGDYLRTAGIARSWQVFAPDPPRQNAFVRVLVEGTDGEVRDLGHEAFGRRRYPYLFYDRMAKINRQLLRREDYRLTYAGWVCRDWERTHGGQAARAVQLVAIRTRVPPPTQAYLGMGWNPLGLDVEEAPPEVYSCASTPHGQLPPSLRARYGLPPAVADFRDVPVRTWKGPRGSGDGGRAGGFGDTATDGTERATPEPIE